MFSNTCASILARIVQSSLANPIIIVKTRLEVLGFNEYNSLYDAANKIRLNEGWMGFFTGLKVSLVRDVPFSGIYYPVYEFSKDFHCRLIGFDFAAQDTQNRTRKLAYVSVMSSLTANFLSCVMTHPIDLIRTRVFFQHHNKDTT